MRRITGIGLCWLLAGSAVAAPADLDTWFNRELVPAVRQQLTTLPRFHNESFRFVVLREDSPQSEGSALAMTLRDRLQNAMSDLPGIRVAWLADQPGVGLTAGTTMPDCTKTEADYFIGVEVTDEGTGPTAIAVRMLDIEERTWVAGFDYGWRGTLNGAQRRMLSRISADPTFRGERDAPWGDSETDLMAAQLAYELGCGLLRQTDGEYVVASTDDAADPSTALVELVANNLAGIRALQRSATVGSANAVIEGKAHRIDDDLYQYWVTITPVDPETDMTTLSADAYVRIPDRYKAAMLVPEATFALARSESNFLSSFSVVRLRDRRSCAPGREAFSDVTGFRRAIETVDCYALQVETADDAVVFFLKHQLNHGLVRLADDNCTAHSMARVARSGEALRLPLGDQSLQSGSWSAGAQWSVEPGQDTYYILAATDTHAARALSRHIEELPGQCYGSLRSGLEGDNLSQWLDELQQISRHWAPAIDWRSIRVRDVY